MSRAVIPLTIVTLFVVAIQLQLLSTLRAAGAVIMLVWLWPFVVGLTGALAPALWVAALSGLFFDTRSTTPFGLTIVVAVVLAWFAARLGREGVGDLDSAAWWVPPVLAGVAGLLAPAGYVVLATLAQDHGLWHDHLVASMVVNALVFAVVARPLARLARRLTLGGRGRS